MKKTIVILLIAIAIVPGVKGQDIHFSQLYNTPLIVNPALTGVFGGDQRAMVIYRNQWSSVATPYKTYGASFDTRFLEKRNGNFALGTGLGLYKDAAGDSDFGLTSVALSVSGIIALNKTQHFTVGLQGGFEQRSINNTALIWDNQYDGSGYDPSRSSQEVADYGTGFSTGDLGAGVAWVYSKSTKRIVSRDDFSLKLGANYRHITQQQLKYGAVPDKLHSKLSFHGESTLSVSGSNMSFKPSFLYQKQGPSQEILVGTLMRYTFGLNSKYTGMMSQTALLIGVHARVGDAFIPSVGYEITNWKLMFSYDANYSALNAASSGVGGFEIALIFVNPNPFSKSKGSSRFN